MVKMDNFWRYTICERPVISVIWAVAFAIIISQNLYTIYSVDKIGQGHAMTQTQMLLWNTGLHELHGLLYGPCTLGDA